MIEIDKRIFRPEGIAQLVPGDQFAGTLQQDLEDLERLPR